MATVRSQLELCQRFGIKPEPPAAASTMGVGPGIRDGRWPLHGLRHRPEVGTNGWYVWAGEDLSQDPEFFEPVHVEHVQAWRPEAVAYLALPPGWRFLIAPDYEDVWEDRELFST